MNTELITIIGGIATTIIGSVASALLTRRKYTSETRSTELKNARLGNEILVDSVVKPLRTEIKYLRNDLNKFRKAIEQIPACPHGSDCPVSRELLANEESGDDKFDIDPAGRRADHARARERGFRSGDDNDYRLPDYQADKFD